MAPHRIDLYAMRTVRADEQRLNNMQVVTFYFYARKCLWHFYAGDILVNICVGFWSETTERGERGQLPDWLYPIIASSVGAHTVHRVHSLTFDGDFTFNDNKV